MGWLAGTLSPQKVWWFVPFLPFLDNVPSPAPACPAPRLFYRHDVRGITLAAPRPRQVATRLSRQPVRRLHRPAPGGAAAGQHLWLRRKFGTRVGQ